MRSAGRPPIPSPPPPEGAIVLWRIVAFEVWFAARQATTWLYAVGSFALAFAYINLEGGAFASHAPSRGVDIVNSPIAVAGMLTLMFLIGSAAVTSLVGGAGVRDFEARMDPLVFTTSVSKSAYLGGRFLGSMGVALVVAATIPLGVAVGAAMPYLERDHFGPFVAGSYWRPFVGLVVPTAVLMGTVAFATGVLVRRSLAVNVASMVVPLGLLIAMLLLRDLDTRSLGALLDPVGLVALKVEMLYWTAAERNTKQIPLGGLVGLNRLFWLAVAAAGWGAMFVRFRFRDIRGRAMPGRSVISDTGEIAPSLGVPRVGRSFTVWTWWAQLGRIARRDLVDMVRNGEVRLFLAGAVILLVVTNVSAKLYSTPSYPVTSTILESLGETWPLILRAAVLIGAGELVWRERGLRVSGIVDTLPVPVWVRYGAKLTALVGLLVVSQLVVLVYSVLTQVWSGYYRFEPLLYAGRLFGIELVDAVLIAVLVLTIYVLVNHRYVAVGVSILVLAVLDSLPTVGLDHNLYRYGSDGGWLYSDLNGYGHFLGPWAWWKLYWGACALLVGVLGTLFWIRSHETGWRSRLAIARRQFGPGSRRLALGALVAWAGVGGWNFYNTNLLNGFETSTAQTRRAADYERAYRRFERAPQPRIVAVSVRADLFPARRAVSFRGRTTLKNMTNAGIDSVHVLLPDTRHLQVRRLELAAPARLVHNNSRLGYRIYALAAPLEPGDSTELVFDLAYEPRGFANHMEGGGVVANGTYITSDLLPHIGYDPRRELTDADARRRAGLPPRRGMAEPSDLVARRNTYVTGDADWIRFEATVATDGDQIGVAPGRLRREWREGHRRVFHYVQDAPVLNYYAFLSARYAVFRDRWHDVDIEILYHPSHTFNVSRIGTAVKRSLAYYTTAFGPYPHRVLRIVEFPRYAVFAQAFPTTVSYSESIGFLARFDPKKNIDYPFYVTAHEVAHQWWAHQVVSGNVRGATMLSETLAQYSALMVMEREYGRPAMRRFLRYELDGYLTGRASDHGGEPPLSRVENETHVHYRKGSLVMYALRDLLGEAAVNDVLARYSAAVRFQAPPYTSAPELVDAFRAAAPASLRGMIDDLFDRIVLYDNRTRTAVARALSDGRYQVELDLSARKVHADSTGRETSVPMNDLVDIGVYGRRRPADRDTVALYLAKHRIRGGEQKISVTVDGEPLVAGIDPEYHLVDRKPSDNRKTVTRPPASR